MHDLIIKLATDAIVLLVVAIGYFTSRFLVEKIGAQKVAKIQSQIELKQGLSYMAVKFVEQAWGELANEHKYDQAAAWLQEQAAALGLKLTTQETRGLIESALRDIKDEFGEEWANVIEEANEEDDPDE